MYQRWYTQVVSPGEKEGRPENRGADIGANLKRVPAVFFRSEAGNEPVRDWLKGKELSREDRKLIGEDIKTVELGWPIGMPTCRPMGKGLYEVRTDLPRNRIARVLFYIDNRSEMVLLHGFIKKGRKTPTQDLEIAHKRQGIHRRQDR